MCFDVLKDRQKDRREERKWLRHTCVREIEKRRIKCLVVSPIETTFCWWVNIVVQMKNGRLKKADKQEVIGHKDASIDI